MRLKVGELLSDWSQDEEEEEEELSALISNRGVFGSLRGGEEITEILLDYK